MRTTLIDLSALDESSEEVATSLFITTGLEGDSTRVIAPAHATWTRVAYAHQRQDEWSVETHAAFWTALLPELTRDGRPRRVDLISRAAAALHLAGLDRGAIAAVLGLTDRSTIRVRETHSRPSLERGARLLQEARQSDPGAAMLRLTGTQWSPWEALPRVWSDEDDEPVGHFNHRIEHNWVPAGIEVAAVAENELRRRWQSRTAARATVAQTVARRS